MTTRETTQLARDALVALVEYHTGVDQVSAINDGRQAIAALTAELAKPEPEPGAYAAQNVLSRKWGYIWHDGDDVKGWISLQNLCRASGTYHGPVPLYLAPPSESAAVALLRQMRADYATFPAGLKDKIDAVLAGQDQAIVPETDGFVTNCIVVNSALMSSNPRFVGKEGKVVAYLDACVIVPIWIIPPDLLNQILACGRLAPTPKGNAL